MNNIARRSLLKFVDFPVVVDKQVYEFEAESLRNMLTRRTLPLYE